MFDLEREIEQWCHTIVDCGCARDTDLNELKDHLHCLVEEHREQGLTEQDAFVEAIKQMGDSRLITDEYARNRTLLQKIAAYDRNLQRSITRRFSGKQLIWFSLGYSAFWGLLMILLAAFGGPAYREQAVTWMIVTMMFWFIPIIIAAADPRVRRAECDFFRKLFHTSSSPIS